MQCDSDQKWSKSLENLPRISKALIKKFFDDSCSSSRHFNRSDLFLEEQFVTALETKNQPELNNILVKAKCYRSFKKNEAPHDVLLTMTPFSVSVPGRDAIVKGECSCTVGLSGHCNHLLACLKLINAYQKQGYSEVPPELACTSKQQQWGRIRTRNEFSFRLTDGSHMECLLYQPCKKPITPTEQLAAVHKIAQEVQAKNSDWSEFLIDAAETSRGTHPTRLGEVPAACTLQYQLNGSKSEYEVITSLPVQSGNRGNVSHGMQWKGYPMDTAGKYLYCLRNSKEVDLLESLRLDIDHSRKIEVNSRSQSESQTWINERQKRLTASRFGQVLKRLGKWSIPALKNLLLHKDLSRVRAIQHGTRCEPIAANRYQAVMNRSGRKIVINHSGLVVNPELCWLAASPDRRVFDPHESSPYGLVEIKCPYSLRMKNAAECFSEPNFYVRQVNGVPSLNRNHEYYFQVLGQMAITGAKWCDFVVFTSKALIIERIRFDSQRWSDTLPELAKFYFNEALHLFCEGTQSNDSSVLKERNART